LLNGIAVIVIALAGVLAYMGLMNWSIRRGALLRLYALDDAAAMAGQDTSGRDSALARWLARAGYRQPNAQTIFIAATVGCVLVGLAVSQFYRLILLRPLLNAIANVPGSAGDLLALVLIAGPWILLMLSGFVPTLVVRSRRRLRVRAIEQDLPLALELFATMAEAGLGFDAALAKVVRAQGSSRPLASEFLNFQHDMMAGMSRTQALRQLGRRVDVQSLSTFTSALVQAEQVGASMAETLQHQANDLRQRRRENALLQAQALPVKLVFPLVVCFLPGIFATTLAPVLFQMVQVANGVLLSSGR
jgi:pilus assembly protein TadC